MSGSSTSGNGATPPATVRSTTRPGAGEPSRLGKPLQPRATEAEHLKAERLWYSGDTHAKIAALVHIKPISVGGWARGRGLTMREERSGPAPKWDTELANKLWTADVAECDVCDTCDVSLNTFRSYRRTHKWFVRGRATHGHARRMTSDEIKEAKNGTLDWLAAVPITMIRCDGCLGQYPYTMDAARCPHCGAERAA